PFVTDLLQLPQRHLEPRVQMCRQPVPALAYLAEQLPRLRRALADDLLVGQAAELDILGARERQRDGEYSLQLVDQSELVGDRKLDVDALDLIGVLTHAREGQ